MPPDRQFYSPEGGLELKADNTIFDVQAWRDLVLMAALAPKDFLFEVAMGKVAGTSMISKFGFNSEIDTATDPEAIWGGGGKYTGFDADVAETVSIASSDGNDTSDGTGARTVELQGLDANYSALTETITLNGLTPVLSTGSFIRLDRAIVKTAGTTQANEGTITCNQSTTTANIFFALPIGSNQTQVCAYTVPAGKTGYLFSIQASDIASTNSESVMNMQVRELGGLFKQIVIFVISQTGGQFFKNTHPLYTLPEKSDVVMVAQSVSVNNTQISGAFDILLVDN